MKTISDKPRKEHEYLLTNAQKETVRLVANSNYTTFILTSGKEITMAYTMGSYNLLLPESFIKVNRSCIINTLFIKTLNFAEQKLVLNDNTEVQIARRLWNNVKKRI